MTAQQVKDEAARLLEKEEALAYLQRMRSGDDSTRPLTLDEAEELLEHFGEL